MDLQNNFIQSDKNLQEVLEKWDKKILPFLPGCLDGLAKKTGAVQRKRGGTFCIRFIKNVIFIWYCVKKKYKLKVNFSYNIPFFHPVNLSILFNFCLYTFSYSFGDRYVQ